MSLEDIRNRLKSIFPINGESILTEATEEEDLFADDGEEDTEEPSDKEDNNSEDNADEEPSDTEDNTDEEPVDTEDNADEEPVDSNLSPEDKINSLFKDSGNPSHDWNLTSEENQRLATFKFKVIGVDYESLMTEQEKAEGVPSNILEQRLTTDEMVVYRDTISELRSKYPLISKREKNIILWNASIPILAKNEKNESVNVYKDNNVINEAFAKIDEYLQNKYNEFWQDDNKAISFIRNIKINFSSEKSKITPHLITNNKLKELSEKDIISFNNVSSDTPESVMSFIKDNMKNELFNKSPVFNTISSDFSQDGSISRGSVYPIIMGTVTEEENTDETEQTDEDLGDSGFGGDFEGGDGGDFGDGGPPIDGEEDLGDGGEDFGDGGEEDLGGDGEDLGDEEL